MSESRFIYTLADYDRETSTVSLRLAHIDIGVSIDAIALIASMDALKAAIDGVSIGLPVSQTRVFDRETLASPNSAAASVNAQRETKWLVRAYDSITFDAVTFEIPAANLALLQGNDGKMDETAGAGLALKTAVEANVVSKAGNPIVWVEALHVGRNS